MSSLHDDEGAGAPGLDRELLCSSMGNLNLYRVDGGAGYELESAQGRLFRDEEDLGSRLELDRGEAEWLFISFGLELGHLKTGEVADRDENEGLAKARPGPVPGKNAGGVEGDPSPPAPLYDGCDEHARSAPSGPDAGERDLEGGASPASFPSGSPLGNAALSLACAAVEVERKAIAGELELICAAHPSTRPRGLLALIKRLAKGER